MDYSNIRNYCYRCRERRNANGLYFMQSSREVFGVYCKQCCDILEMEIIKKKEDDGPIHSRFEILDLRVL